MTRDAIFFIMGITVMSILALAPNLDARSATTPDPAVLASSKAAADAAADARVQAHANGEQVKKLAANIDQLTGEISKLEASLFCLHEEYRHPKQVEQDGGFYGCAE